jgi:hypothetical protein
MAHHQIYDVVRSPSPSPTAPAPCVSTCRQPIYNYGEEEPNFSPLTNDEI